MNKLALVVIPIYLLCVTVFIGYVGSKMKSFKDFALGGGAMPWFVTAGTMIAAMVGGGTLVGYVGSYYLYGMQWAWMGLGIFAGYMILLGFSAGRIKRLNLFTVSDMFNVRYGRTTKICAAVIVIIGDFAVYCAMLSSFATILYGFVGIPYQISMVFGLILFICSATLGGLKGVAYADVIQASLIILGIIVVGVVTFVKVGGFTGLNTLGNNMTSMLATNIPPKVMAGNVISLTLMCLVSQSTIIQKLNACKSERDAKKAILVVGIAVAGSCIFLISVMGLGAKILFGDGITPADNVIVTLLSDLNPIIAVLYSAAIVAAILTTANSMLISSSMSFSVDFLRGFKEDISDRRMVLAGKIFIVVAACLGFILVKFIPQVIKWIMLTYTMQSCLFIPLYGGLMFKRPSALSGTLAVVFAGVGVGVWEILKTPFQIHSIFVALVLGVLGMVLGMIFDHNVTEGQKRVVDVFMSKDPTVRL